MTEPLVIEHGSSKPSRWLRERRTRVALWAAAIEGLLVVVHAIPRIPALIVAVVLVVAYFAAFRNIRSPLARQLGWVVAVWQALVLLVPVLLILIGTLALILVAILAAVALAFLFIDRR